MISINVFKEKEFVLMVSGGCGDGVKVQDL